MQIRKHCMLRYDYGGETVLLSFRLTPRNKSDPTDTGTRLSATSSINYHGESLPLTVRREPLTLGMAGPRSSSRDPGGWYSQWGSSRWPSESQVPGLLHETLVAGTHSGRHPFTHCQSKKHRTQKSCTLCTCRGVDRRLWRSKPGLLERAEGSASISARFIFG